MTSSRSRSAVYLARRVLVASPPLEVSDLAADDKVTQVMLQL